MQSTPLSATADGSVAHSLASLLESSARRHQDRPALLAADRAALSHAQLWDHVSTTVQELNRLGVGREDRVILALPQGADLALTLATQMGWPVDIEGAYQDDKLYLLQGRPISAGLETRG